MSSEGAESDHRKTAPLNSVRGELYSEGGSPECEEIKTDKHSYYIQRHSSNQDSDFLRSSRRQSIGSFDSQTSSTTADTRMPGRAELPAKMHNRQVAPAAPAVLVASDRERSGPRRPSTLSDSATNIQEDLIAVLQSKTEDYDTDEVRSHNTVKKLFGSDTVDSKSRTSQTTVVHSHRQVDRSISSKGQERERLSNKKPEWDGNKKIIYNEGGSWPVSSSSRRDSGAKLFNSSRTLTAKSATARTHSTASAVLPHRGQAPAASALPINPTREHHAHFQDERSSNTSSRWCSSLDKGRRSDGKTSRSDDYFAIAAARGIRTRTMGDHGSFIPPPLPLEVQRRRQIGRREMY